MEDSSSDDDDFMNLPGPSTRGRQKTLKEVGLWLRTQPFTHGQLYVACSRVGKPGSLKFALKKENDGNIEKATNIVFKEVLLNN